MEQHGSMHLASTKSQTELSKIKKEIAVVKKQLATLEFRKAVLERSVGKKS
jgi:flagellar motility protein MotE (MotC chaperone)